MRAAVVDGSWLQDVWRIKVPEPVPAVEAGKPELQAAPTETTQQRAACCHAVARRSRLACVRAVLHDYSRTSTLHGVALVGNKSLSKCERCLWAAAVAVSAALLVVACRAQFQVFATAPSITRLEQNNLPTYSIAFPAVTVCQPTRIKLEELFSIVDVYLKSLTGQRESDLWDALRRFNLSGQYGQFSEGKDKMPMLLVGIVETLVNYHFPRFRIMKRGLSLIGDQLRYLDGLDIAQIMIKTRLSCKDLLVRCYWKGIAFKCCEQFQLQRTEMGYCMSFNSRTSTGPKILCSERNCHHVWSSGPGTGLVMVFNDLRKLMKQRPLTHAYIRQIKTRVLAERQWRKSTLEAVWDSEEVFMDVRTWLERHYIQVMVHDRRKFPVVEQAFAFSTEIKTDFSMAVAYSITVAADNLQLLSLKERNCLFSNEAKLETAEQYSQTECITECRMQHVVDRCGCRPYYMEIRGERSGSVPQCRFSQLPCLSALNMVAINCSHCITTCRVSRFTFTVHPSISAHISDANIGTSIDISYDSNRAAVLYRHQRAHSFIDMWVTIGSLASLFLGSSILSILDLLHLVLRVVRVALGSDINPVFHTNQPFCTLCSQ